MLTDIAKLQTYLPDTSPQAVELFSKLYDIAQHYSHKGSLFAPSVANSLSRLLFADSVLGLQCLLKEHSLPSECFDVGLSNGFPGLILSVLRRDIQINIVEPVSFKQEYLKTAIAELNLANCTVLTKATESIPKSSVALAFHRGTSSLTNSLIALGTVIKPKGIVCFYKADNWSSEVAACPTQIFSKWEIGAIGSYALPESNIQRTILVAQRK